MADNFVKGLDVSHYNGTVDWSQVATAGIVFAYAKATEGTTVRDTQFHTNYLAMREHQILRGAYHFFRPGLDPQAQAENFLNLVPAVEPGDLPPTLDVEVGDGQPAQVIIPRVLQWLQTIEAALGRTPVLYTSRNFWNANLGGSADFGRYPLWVAHYTTNVKPVLPSGFGDYVFWQHSETGQVAGITGSVDLDRFHGSPTELNQLAGL